MALGKLVRDPGSGDQTLILPGEEENKTLNL